MKNILKNDRLDWLIALLAVFFVGNVFSMKMTEQGKARASRMMMQLKQQGMSREAFMSDENSKQKEREKQYQPDTYFVYEKGTSKGVPVGKTYLENTSQKVKDMLSDVINGELQEIMVPFSFDTIKLIFVHNKSYKKINLEQLKDAINCVDYLGMEYKDQYPPIKSFVEAMADCINDIGLTMLNIAILSQYPDQNIPDYSILKHLNNSYLEKGVKSWLIANINDKQSFLKEYVIAYNDAMWRSDIDLNKKISWDKYQSEHEDLINELFNMNGSIIDLLDVVKKYAQQKLEERRERVESNKIYKEQQREWEEKQAKKWFWQRWMGW